MNTDQLTKSLPKGQFTGANIIFMLTLLPKVNMVNGSYLEVGSLLGRSSVLIGMEAKKQKEKLTCIDLWEKEEWLRHRKKPACPDDIFGTFTNNMKNRGLQKTVIPIKGDSKDYVANWAFPLRFIHIDGNHNYEAVLIDTGWKKHLSLGGIICFHDYCDSAPGVIRAVNEELVMNDAFVKVGIRHSLIAFKRVKLRAPCSHNGGVHKK